MKNAINKIAIQVIFNNITKEIEAINAKHERVYSDGLDTRC